MAWGFETLDLERIVTFTNVDNAGMNGIARKLGMIFLGEADAIGPWKDNNLYAISRAEWESRPHARRLTADEAAAIVGPESDKDR